jgi:hypothetical protein
VDGDILRATEEFACALYGKERIKDVNELRFFLLNSKCTGKGKTLSMSNSFDLNALPPCSDSLREHLNRVNYQVGIWKRAHVPKPVVPDQVDGHGWTHAESGELIPKWTDGDVLPVQVADVLETLETDSESESEGDDDDGEDMSSDSSDGRF